MRTWTTTKTFCAALLATLLIPGAARALTADEVLQLRQAGVSDATIQQMLKNESQKNAQQRADVPSAMQNEKFANDHIGSWNTTDGRVVLSTGRIDPQRDVFDPTVPQNPNDDPQQMNVYPFVFPGGSGGTGGGGPVLGPHGPIGGGMGPR
jgi:hypothetical protein